MNEIELKQNEIESECSLNGPVCLWNVDVECGIQNVVKTKVRYIDDLKLKHTCFT